MQLIFLTGLPRTGTNWTSRTLAAATNSKLAHEPFNWKFHPEHAGYHMKYLPAGSEDVEFISIVRRAIYPGARVVLKDVHCCLALEYLWEQLRPLVVIMIRHPCAMANSWAKVGFEVSFRLDILLEQEQLIEEHLLPFRNHIKNSDEYFFQLGAYWGAGYYVLSRIASKHKDWQWVTHESLCRQPALGFETLLQTFGLEMEEAGYIFLEEHNRELKEDEGPFFPARISAKEPDKWKRYLNPEQVAAVLDGVKPFGIMEAFYTD